MQAQIEGQRPYVVSHKPTYDLFCLPQECGEVGSPDGVAHDDLGRLDRFLAQSGEHDEHAGVALGKVPVVGPVEEHLLCLAGLLALEFAGGVGPDQLEERPTILLAPCVHETCPSPMFSWLRCWASAMSRAALPRDTQPLAVPAGTPRTSAISACERPSM